MQIEQRQMERAKENANEWVTSTNPVIVRDFLQGVAWHRGKRTLWYCPPYLSDLKCKLEAEGKDFTSHFIKEVALQFRCLERPLMVVRHLEGLADGKHWAANHSTTEQLNRLRDNLTDPVYHNDFERDGSLDGSEWTPAHELTALVLGGTYPATDGELAADCEEFRRFWQPYLTTPIDTVIADLNRPECSGKYKIQDGDYVVGFIDGALGLSDQMRDRLAAPVPSRAVSACGCRES